MTRLGRYRGVTRRRRYTRKAYGRRTYKRSGGYSRYYKRPYKRIGGFVNFVKGRAYDFQEEPNYYAHANRAAGWGQRWERPGWTDKAKTAYEKVKETAQKTYQALKESAGAPGRQMLENSKKPRGFEDLKILNRAIKNVQAMATVAGALMGGNMEPAQHALGWHDGFY